MQHLLLSVRWIKIYTLNPKPALKKPSIDSKKPNVSPHNPIRRAKMTSPVSNPTRPVAPSTQRATSSAPSHTSRTLPRLSVLTSAKRFQAIKQEVEEVPLVDITAMDSDNNDNIVGISTREDDNNNNNEAELIDLVADEEDPEKHYDCLSYDEKIKLMY
eukprot:GHVL01028826.1.p1 GENE.GHVL01028826.1~~GHVL01028826.1.p1  ORF type:complete len:159 (-),score=17.64 GHVL01028826.1:69-545(-)